MGPWSAKDDHLLITLRKQGKSSAIIAQKLQRTTKACAERASKLRKKNGKISSSVDAVVDNAKKQNVNENISMSQKESSKEKYEELKGDRRRVQTVERPYKCPFCDKSFAQHSHLLNHIKSHLGNRPFECEQCKKCFGEIESLRNHMKVCKELLGNEKNEEKQTENNREDEVDTDKENGSESEREEVDTQMICPLAPPMNNQQDNEDEDEMNITV